MLSTWIIQLQKQLSSNTRLSSTPFLILGFIFTFSLLKTIRPYYWSWKKIFRTFSNVHPPGDNCDKLANSNTTRVYHLWYQWIPFYFWLASAAFFLPYLIYKVGVISSSFLKCSCVVMYLCSCVVVWLKQ